MLWVIMLCECSLLLFAEDTEESGDGDLDSNNSPYLISTDVHFGSSKMARLVIIKQNF